MTFAEFQLQRIMIEGKTFSAQHSHPALIGWERAHFQEQKFRDLIVLARRSKLKTAQTKLSQWERQLQRATEARERFAQLSNGGGND
jgi:hypothetical protein